MKTLLKKNDNVVVRTGSEKGKSGKIIRIDRKEGTVAIEKLKIVKRHTRPTQQQPQGGIVEKEGPIAISNVLLFCKKCDKGVRAGVSVQEDGTKSRICKKCGEIL